MKWILLTEQYKRRIVKGIVQGMCGSPMIQQQSTVHKDVTQRLIRKQRPAPKVTLQRSPWKNLSWELSPIITEADKKIKYVPIAQLDRAHAS